MSAGISGFQGTEGSLGKKSGGDGAVGTPVPIPNTEVKHRSGEGSSLGGENSAPPGFFPLRAPFLPSGGVSSIAAKKRETTGRSGGGNWLGLGPAFLFLLLYIGIYR